MPINFFQPCKIMNANIRLFEFSPATFVHDPQNIHACRELRIMHEF